MIGLALATPAGAHRLSYANVLGGPMLGYETMPIADAPTASFSADPEAGPVRAFYGDRFEVITTRDGDAYSWDVSAEVGSQGHRLWLATAGDASPGSGLDYVETQALYSHPILDEGLAIQAGVRRDFVRPRRTYAVLGLQGNLTEPFYVGAFGFLSTKSELSGRLFAYYDWSWRDNIVLQPYAGLELAARDMPELGLGRGFTEAELSLRLRYEVRDGFAPYLGLRWDSLLGRTARIARQAGEEVDALSMVIGLRSYF